ncbi:MAG: ATP-binding protein [Acidobacteriota bacterium]
MNLLRVTPPLRFALVWPLLAAVGVVAPLIFFVSTGPLEEGTATLLLDTVQILQPQAERAVPLEPRARQAAIRTLGASSAIRVTLIAEDGEVLAESSLDWAAMRAMDNHASRPEIVAAFRGSEGTSVRYSDTIEVYFAYAARSFIGDDGARYVLRLARPLEQVHILRRNLGGLLMLALLSGLLVLGPVAWWMHHGLFQPLQRILAGAAELSRGEFSTRVDVPRSAELATLAGSLNRLAGEVEVRIDELAAERNDLREILASMSEGILALDAEGTIRRANAAAARLFGVDGSLLDRSAGSLHPALGELVATALRSAKERALEIEIERPERRFLALLACPLPAGHGVVVAVRDLTESLRLAEIRRDLVANVSHELKTPLTAIRGYAETLEDGALTRPAVATSFVQRILEQCARLEDLVRDLLALARLENRDEPLRRDPVDLGAAAARAVDLLRDLARQRDVELELDITSNRTDESSDLPRVLGDREALERMILNLVENAIKYSQSGGRVDVRLALERDDQARIVLTVHDDGLGIPAESLGRIFERFYRVDKGRARDQGGTGLGLTLVKHTARAHGGQVTVDSTLGHGSTFRVVLPALDLEAIYRQA